MPDDDVAGALTRKHSQRNLARVDGDVLNMLVKLAHANGWIIKEMLQGARSLVDQATDDLDERQAYKDRLTLLLDGLD